MVVFYKHHCYVIIGLFHFAWIFSFLQIFSTSLIPAPIDVFFSLKNFLFSKDFYENFATTFFFTLKGVGIATLISLPISYLFFISFFKQLSLLSTKLRYLSMAGIAFVFTILFKVDTDIKMSLILFGIIPFFVTSLIASFSDNINEKLDLCRVNRFNSFETLKEVVIIGKLDQVFEIIRQNFAICWIVITFAETKCMGQGGLGTLIAVGGVVLASLFIVMDLDQIEKAVAARVPQEESWRCAFGLMVTLVWLYMEVLRLISILRSND